VQSILLFIFQRRGLRPDWQTRACRAAPLKNKKKGWSGGGFFYKQATPTGFEPLASLRSA
jgi:hypothetical protein